MPMFALPPAQPLDRTDLASYVCRVSEDPALAEWLESVQQRKHSSASLERDFEYQKRKAQIRELLRLESGWDTYEAEPPNDVSVETAISFARILRDLDFDPNAIIPSAEGGVAVAFVEGGRVAQVEFFNDGDINAVMYSKEEDPIVWDLGSGEPQLLETAQRIREYIRAEAA